MGRKSQQKEMGQKLANKTPGRLVGADDLRNDFGKVNFHLIAKALKFFVFKLVVHDLLEHLNGCYLNLNIDEGIKTERLSC